MLLSVSGMFFGALPTLIAGIIMIAYRVIIGGPGMYMGVAVILTTSVMGVLWHKFRFQKILHRKYPYIIEFLIFGLIVHIDMLLCMLFLPEGLFQITLHDIFLPVIILYPIGTYLLCIIFLSQFERNRLLKKLMDSEEKYRKIAENTSDVIWTADLDLNLTYLSPSVERLFGRNSADYINISLEDKYPIDDLNKLRSILREELEKETEETCDKYRSRIIEVKHYHASGSLLWISMHVSFMRDEQEQICGVTGIMRDITERKQKEEEIFRLAYYDHLTGLYNRRFYEEELQRMDVKRNLPFTVVMGDVNGLKLINDSFGHHVGDELLKKVAEMIKKSCRADDIIARFGGDEFGILLPHTSAPEADGIIERIQVLSLNEKINGLDISISFGHETKEKNTENINDIIKKAEDNMYRNKLFESTSMRSKTIDFIMNALYEKNNREMLHSKRVSKLCKEIALLLKLGKEAVEQVALAGLVHDIGKIGIDEKILNSPDKLNDDEWNEMKKHSEIGYRILSSANEFSDIARFVLEHQEKWDGSGYPKGLVGKEISFEARIISIADAYDAMTGERTYGKVFTRQEALEEIERCACIHFDPDIVDIFVTKMRNEANDVC
nr:HD domain-containing phosphohydrolase [Dehalobacter sp. UNSWDHB]